MEDEIRVLVVEDDENVRIGVEQAVALAGFPVSAYASAADALADIAPGAPVVIVSVSYTHLRAHQTVIDI